MKDRLKLQEMDYLMELYQLDEGDDDNFIKPYIKSSTLTLLETTDRVVIDQFLQSTLKQILDDIININEGLIDQDLNLLKGKFSFIRSMME